MTTQPEAMRLADLLEQIDGQHWQVQDSAAAELRRLHATLERERMRLVACGVVALADTPDSAKHARQMHPDYESASCQDVARRVDECISLRAQRDAMQERAEYWKRKHDDEETGAERYALRVQRDELLAALRVFVSCALPVSTEIDERGHRWTEAYLDQALLNARAAIKAAEENT